jgi:NADH:ubiquinone oxidoreductase subunit 6 (subunit J)|tara:strand:- start:778 stop:879 length:102 start_codon:yes stop_codon:yes gene_type:complete
MTLVRALLAVSLIISAAGGILFRNVTHSMLAGA